MTNFSTYNYVTQQQRLSLIYKHKLLKNSLFVKYYNYIVDFKVEIFNEESFLKQILIYR